MMLRFSSMALLITVSESGDLDSSTMHQSDIYVADDGMISISVPVGSTHFKSSSWTLSTKILGNVERSVNTLLSPFKITFSFMKELELAISSPYSTCSASAVTFTALFWLIYCSGGDDREARNVGEDRGDSGGRVALMGVVTRKASFCSTFVSLEITSLSLKNTGDGLLTISPVRGSGLLVPAKSSLAALANFC